MCLGAKVVKNSGSMPSLNPFILSMTTAATVAFYAGTAVSAPIDVGNSDIRMSWDNTVKYSLGVRLEDQDPDVVAAFNPNVDDGNLNLDKGLISNRLDLLSQFDVSYKRQFSFRLTAAAWYDSVYHEETDFDEQVSISNNVEGGASEFPDDTVDLHGGKAEILDAFIQGKWEIGEQQALTLRLGRYAQIYGTSLFFGGNGIAAAQAPIDVVKALSVPGTTFQEIIRPVAQIGGTYIINSDVSVSAYQQFEWERSVLPGVGSYFSPADFFDEGGDILFGPPELGNLSRLPDTEPDDAGQFGLSINLNTGDYDLGLYAAQFHDKGPLAYIRPGPGGGYTLVYPEDIKVLGASISTSFADTNVAAEVSYRYDTPLSPLGNAAVDVARVGDGGNNALHPVGTSAHAQASVISILNEGALWDGASLLGEIAFNRIDSIDKNAELLDPTVTRSASAARVLFEPQYFRVINGLDLSVPISIGYGLSGVTAVPGTAMPAEDTGDFSIGVNFNYKSRWLGGLLFTHFIGDPGAPVNMAGEISGKQVYADRDFISFNIRRSF